MQSVQDRISLRIKAKRRETGQGLREAAAEAKISPATLSRLERGASPTLPDAGTLTKLADWLGISLSELLGDGKSGAKAVQAKNSTPELVEVHLRADKNLTPESARALAQMFKAIYEQVTKTGIPSEK